MLTPIAYYILCMGCSNSKEYNELLVFCHKLVKGKFTVSYVTGFNPEISDIEEMINNIYTLDCSGHELTGLPSLPNCVFLDCSDNLITNLPPLPVCEKLLCGSNRIERIENLPKCERIECSKNKPHITFKNLPKCVELVYRSNQ